MLRLGLRTIGVGTTHWIAPPLPPNRSCGSPANGSPVSKLPHSEDRCRSVGRRRLAPRRLPFGDICKQLPVQVWAFRLRCSSPIGQSSSDGMTPFPLVCFRFPATLRSTGVTPLLHYYDGSESCSALFPAIYPSRSPAFTCTLFLGHTITNHTGMHTLRIRDITQVLQGSRPADFAIC